MKKTSKITEAYSDLARIGRGPIDDDALVKIRKAIGGSSSLIVSEAVDIVAAHGLQQFIPEMILAFSRFAEDGVKTDKGCRAKTSIINALNGFEYLGDEVFRFSTTYRQLEPAYGGTEDTAIELRSMAALAIARINHPEAHYLLGDMLVDPSNQVRIAAVKAIAFLGTSESEVMLRLRTIVGDADEVVAECFLGLMKMAPGRSLEFVSRYLRGHGALQMESAAIALGSSHLTEALSVLMQFWEEAHHTTRRSLLLPIALIRSDASFDFLLDVLNNTDRQTAADTLEAMRLYTSGPYIDRMRDAVNARNDSQLTAKFRDVFGE